MVRVIESGEAIRTNLTLVINAASEPGAIAVPGTPEDAREN